MWSPTHVQVTVCRARGLLSKGKNGTNDCFVTISLGKEKFQTSVKLKSPTNLEWQEECELPIPSQGNTAEIVLTALHQNFIGVDEFLGMISLPLAQFDVYDRPRTKWYPLNSKPGQAGKNKSRGEIEVKVGFTVKSGSMLDLSKKEKHKGSFGHITQAAHNIGGSLMNLGGKDKKGNIKKLASTVGSKLRLNKKNGAGDDKEGRLSRHSSGRYSGKYSSGDPDPGVISEDDDEFRFDELSHKSSGSSLNLAGSSQASGQGSLENLGGGELLRQNSMKRSGSSVSSLQSRAVPSASSSSTNLAALAAANSAASKSPGGKSDWKLFGKQEKGEPVKPVVAEPVIRAPATSFSSAVPSSSVVLDQVPSIIIKDSFVVEEPSLSPPLVIEPSPKSRKAPAPPVPVADPPPPIKPRRKVEDEPITAPGEDDDSASWSRMQVPSLSFPVASTHDDHALSAPPVPKPRRSPIQPESLPPSTLPRHSLPEPVPLNPFDDEDVREPVTLNPFDDEDDYEDEVSTEDAGLVTLMEASNEDEEAALNEASVCQMLEEAIEGHEINVKPDEMMEDEEEGGLVMQVRTPTAVELFSEDAMSAENTIDIHLEQTIDLFDHQSGEEISPVEKATTSRQLNNSSATTPPVQSEQPTHSNRGFFSTPRYTPETPMVTKNISVVRLDWMEHTDEEDGSSSQGFGGSVQTASTAESEAALQATTKTMDSALPDEEEEEEPVDLEGARNRRLSSILPRPSAEFTPPQLLPVPELTDTPFVPTSATSSTSSAKADLSWDSEYDMNPLPGTPQANLAPGKGRRSMVPYDPVPILSPLGEEEKARRKRVSLAPSLKPMSWNDTLDSTQSSPGSLFSEDSDEAEEKAAALAGATQNSEAQRMKMAASFHQRVVVGEDKPVNNVTPKDFHTPRDSPSTEDRQRLYQGKSREGLIGLLEERDKQISDLKNYIDSLLLRVIDTCPTVLQTPIKSKNSPQ